MTVGSSVVFTNYEILSPLWLRIGDGHKDFKEEFLLSLAIRLLSRQEGAYFFFSLI